MKPDMKSTSIKNLKEEYVKEYDFISDLIHRSNLPTAELDSSGNSHPLKCPTLFEGFCRMKTRRSAEIKYSSFSCTLRTNLFYLN